MAGDRAGLAAGLDDGIGNGLAAIDLAAGNDDVCALLGEQLGDASPIPRLAPETKAILPSRSNRVVLDMGDSSCYAAAAGLAERCVSFRAWIER